MKVTQISTGSSKGNCYTYKNLMLDLGVSYRRLVNKKEGVNHLEGIDYIFISHNHGDHFYYGNGKYTTALNIKEKHPNIKFIAGENFKEIFEELELNHMIIPEGVLASISLKGREPQTLMKFQLVKLYHDIPNYGLRFIEHDRKGIYITDTKHIDDIEFYNYDTIIIEYNHDVETHKWLAENSEWPPRYENALNSHLSFEQSNQALARFAKEGSEILRVHMSSDEVYQAQVENGEIDLHFFYTGGTNVKS